MIYALALCAQITPLCGRTFISPNEITYNRTLFFYAAECPRTDCTRIADALDAATASTAPAQITTPIRCVRDVRDGESATTAAMRMATVGRSSGKVCAFPRS